MNSPNRIVLGLGNLLLGDEGLGIRAVQAVAAHPDLPGDITCLDGGVMGLELLAHLANATHLLVIDTIQTGQAPGTLVRLEGDQVPKALPLKLSAHEIGFQELLALNELRGLGRPHLVVWGLVPAVLEPGVMLSERIATQLDALVQAVLEELRLWDRPAARS